MGFKRTTEGRVFFQGSNDTVQENRLPTAPQSQPQAQPQTQVQILSLLRALNEKLKSTQTERHQMRQELESYRTMVQNLEAQSQNKDKSTEQRAAQAEKIAQDVMKELRETRKLMLAIEDKAEQADKGFSALKVQVGQTQKIGDEIVKRQVRLEKSQQEFAEKSPLKTLDYEGLVKRLEHTEKKQEDLGSKIEEAIAEQAKIARQIDKAIEDRARFMRKIERIEETVIQTRDALNAKAMVLLTDQSAAGASDVLKGGLFPSTPNKNAEQRQVHTDQSESMDTAIIWWKKPARTQALLTGLVVLVALLGGWGISQWQKIELPEVLDETAEFSTAADESALASVLGQESVSQKSPQEAAQESLIEESARALETLDEVPEKIETQATEKPLVKTDDEKSTKVSKAANDPVNDIAVLDVTDDRALAAMLESDPERVAAALNDIAPGARAPADREMVAAEALTPEELEPVKQPLLTAPKAINNGKMMKPDRDLPDRVKAIETQALAGVPEAQHDLAAIYTAGQGGVRQNYERAAFWFEQAAKKGIPNARYNLGVLYHQGLGVKPDLKSAIYWYQQAADLGHPEAQYNLGIAYIEGIGVKYDPKKAEQYFESAATQGIMEAAYNLGLIYENGLLGNTKPEEALLWYKTAADKGSPEAKAALEQLAKNLGISSDDVNRAVDNMKSSKKASASVQKKSAGQKTAAIQAEDTANHETSKTNAAPSGQDTIADIQQYLMSVGLYPGPADGNRTPQMQDAIRAYQSVNGLTMDGKPTRELLSHMMASNGASVQESFRTQNR